MEAPEVGPPEATLRLALKICLNVFVVSRVVSLAQLARALRRERGRWSIGFAALHSF